MLLKRVFAPIAALVVLAGPLPNALAAPTVPPPARVRLLNTVLSTDKKSAFCSRFDGVSYGPFVSLRCLLGFKGISKYNKKFVPSTYEVHVIGGNNTIFHDSHNLPFTSGQDITFLACGTEGNIESIAIEQPTIASTAQSLQFVNASWNAGPVDFTYTSLLGDSHAAANISFKGTSTASSLLPSYGMVEVKAAGTSNVLISKIIKLKPGRRTLFVLVGASGSSIYPLQGAYYDDKAGKPGKSYSIDF